MINAKELKKVSDSNSKTKRILKELEGYAKLRAEEGQTSTGIAIEYCGDSYTEVKALLERAGYRVSEEGLYAVVSWDA